MSERLPELGEDRSKDILVKDEDGDLFLAFLSEEGDWFNARSYYTVDGVVEWMEVPE